MASVETANVGMFHHKNWEGMKEVVVLTWSCPSKAETCC
jgi:hypothetical protein